MTLPHTLLQAVSAPGGGKITLVVGAGCSFEAPTLIPLAGTCSQQCHDRLVANGVLALGDCALPSNLSCLADTVFAKTGEQRLLVEQLSQHYELKTASPNDGHLLTAALLREGAIASVVTLNFDLALSTAISLLGVGDVVGVIDGPDDLPNKKALNLYYLHRNANAADPETWVLRTAALDTEWNGRWEQVVAAMVLATPVVVFAGLGSPANVLVQSATLIRNAIPNGSKAYQVDPGDPEMSEFFKALALAPDAFIRKSWCEFMEQLSQRLVVEHACQLKAAAEAMVQREKLHAEDLTTLLDRLQSIGLLNVGRLRANWLLHGKEYFAEELLARELLADLLLAAALIARVTGTQAVLCDDGVVEFRRGDRTVATHVFASGRGTRGQVAIETTLTQRRRRLRDRAMPLSGAIIAGTHNGDPMPITPPADVLLGDTSASIVFGPTALPMFHVDSLRQDSTKCQQVAP
ncbi:MAG: hypothetical protein IPK72_24920 [Candidatus Eisenbacteria bacterium]|nr:hypothetical protein [Candidatus Eisenbacteria bacterium]